jgi:hypothetical protein
MDNAPDLCQPHLMPVLYIVLMNFHVGVLYDECYICHVLKIAGLKFP